MKHSKEEETSQDEKLLREISARAFPSSSTSTSTDREEQGRVRPMARPPRRAADEGSTSPPERGRTARPAGPAHPPVHAEENLKIPSKLVDPCQAARKASHRCLDRNNYDKSLCYDYFEVYRECQKRWVDSRKK